MGLSSSLLSQFAKATKPAKNTNTETTLYATAVEYNGQMYVRLDGSELLTPVATTTDITNGERVTVLIKNHQATVTGNISSPAARTDDVKAARAEIKEGKFIAEAEAFLEPGLPECEYMKELLTSGRDSFTAEELALYDFNGDGNITMTDQLLARKAYLRRDGFTLATWSGAKTSKLTVTIDISNPQKAVRIQGVNMWGRSVDVYMGANSLLMEDDAYAKFEEMVKDCGGDLFLDKNGTALRATCDADGNDIPSTYARKDEVNSSYAGGLGCMRIEGNQICYGWITVKYAATTASSNHYYGDSTEIVNGAFAKAFSSPPIVQLTVAQGTTSVFGVELVSVSKTGITGVRVHRASSYSDTEGLMIHYIAMGPCATE